ncbi:hypothetical protein [Corallococcus sicarius]|uniref:hypothetical protein n=1 Tax=Corallococcus sicarius TaxID=2316726 RepID=UPI0034E0DD9B
MSERHPTPEYMRRAIVHAVHQEDLPCEQTAGFLGIGETTVGRVLQLYRKIGDVAPRPQAGENFSRSRGKMATQLTRRVAQNPAATVRELIEALAARKDVLMSRPSMRRVLH